MRRAAAHLSARHLVHLRFPVPAASAASVASAALPRCAPSPWAPFVPPGPSWPSWVQPVLRAWILFGGSVETEASVFSVCPCLFGPLEPLEPLEPEPNPSRSDRRQVSRSQQRNGNGTRQPPNQQKAEGGALAARRHAENDRGTDARGQVDSSSKKRRAGDGSSAELLGGFVVRWAVRRESTVASAIIFVSKTFRLNGAATLPV